MNRKLRIKNLKLIIEFLHKVFFPLKNLSPKKRRALTGIALLVLLITIPLSVYVRNAGIFEAAWFNTNWGFRQAIPVTSTEGAIQNNVFVSFTLDTATLITAGKMKSNCSDIRITDVNGNLLKYHIGRTNACNNISTSIDFLLSSFPDGQSIYYVYYGNPSNHYNTSS